MGSEDVQTNLRLPADLKEKLVIAAAANNRSLSAEVVSRIQASFEHDSKIEEMAMRHGFETVRLGQEIERLSELLRSARPLSAEEMKAQTAALVAEAIKRVYAEAGDTIENARQAVDVLKAAGKWPIKKSPSGFGAAPLKSRARRIHRAPDDEDPKNS